MAETQPQFHPLKEVGAISYSSTSDVRFYVDEFRGRRYAAVRRFLRSPRYTGPTRSGVTLDGEMLSKVVEAIESYAGNGGEAKEQELGRFSRRPGVELVVRIQIYKEKAGIDIREWLDSDQYSGWSKKGVRIPHEKLPDLRTHLKALKDALKAQA
jgi:hypothetical protein